MQRNASNLDDFQAHVDKAPWPLQPSQKQNNSDFELRKHLKTLNFISVSDNFYAVKAALGRQANVASYDFSAVLYFSTQRLHFEGAQA